MAADCAIKVIYEYQFHTYVISNLYQFAVSRCLAIFLSVLMRIPEREEMPKSVICPIGHVCSRVAIFRLPLVPTFIVVGEEDPSTRGVLFERGR